MNINSMYLAMRLVLAAGLLLAGGSVRAATLGATNLVVGPAAGTNSVVLGASGPWTASTTNSWLHLSTANASGTNNANVIFTFDANPGPTRTGAVTIAGATLTVTQAGSSFVRADFQQQLWAHIGTAAEAEARGVSVDGDGNVYFATHNTGASAGDALMIWGIKDNAVTNLTSSKTNYTVTDPLYVAAYGKNSSNLVYFTTGSAGYLGDRPLVLRSYASYDLYRSLYATNAGLQGIAVDANATVYVSDGSDTIRRFTDLNSMQPITLGGVKASAGLAVDAAGNLYFSSESGASIGIYEWQAGSTSNSVKLLAQASVNLSDAVAVDGSGNVYFVDNPGNAIKVRNAASGATTVLVSVLYPKGVAVDENGNVYFSSFGNQAQVSELVHAWVDTTPRNQPKLAGSYSLPLVLPATTNLRPPFAPTAKAGQSWLSITNAQDGVVSYSLAENDTGSNRVATISVLGQTITITQAGTLAAPLVVSQSAIVTDTMATLNGTVNPGGGATGYWIEYGQTPSYGSTSSVGTLDAGTSAVAVSNVISGLTGYTVYHYRMVATNSAGTNMTADATFTEPAHLGVTTLEEGPSAGSDHVSLSYGGAWTNTSSVSWLSLDSGSLSGSGSTNISFSFDANTGDTPRTGTLTIAGATLTVTQFPTLSFTHLSVGPTAGSSNVVLKTSGAWTASSDVPWLHLDLASISGSGSASVGFSYDSNTGATPRTGTLTIAGGTVTVTQFQTSLGLRLGVTNLTVEPAAGTNSVVLAATAGSWVASTDAPWLRVSPAGFGSTNILFSYDANPSITNRSGVLTIAGLTLTVNQAGAGYVPATAALLFGTSTNGTYLAVDDVGNVYFNNYSDRGAIWEWNVASQTQSSLVSGLIYPSYVTVDHSGLVYFGAIRADFQGEYSIRVWNPVSQTLTALAPGFIAGGLGVDGANSLYALNGANGAITKWTAGNPPPTSLGNLPNGPIQMAVDVAGNVYFKDTAVNAARDAVINSVKMWNAVSQTVSTLYEYPGDGDVLDVRGLAVDGSGNVYFSLQPGEQAVMKWNAASRIVTPLVASEARAFGVAADGAGNVYYRTLPLSFEFAMEVDELPRAWVSPTWNKAIPRVGGSDALLPIAPATVNLRGGFAPTSDQSWLSITSANDGVVSFSSTANLSGAARVAHINVLGQSVPVTQSSLPVLASPFATDVTRLTATLNATVNPEGAATSYWFEYGATDSYGLRTSTNQIGGTSDAGVNHQVPGLTAGTLYHFRFVAVNQDGRTESSDRTFTTLPPVAPTISQVRLTNLTESTATLRGTVDSGGLETTYWFEYGLTTNYNLATTHTNLVAGLSGVDLSADISGFTPGATNHFRMVATNNLGSVVSADKTFIALTIDPVITGLTATNVTTHSATLRAIVNPGGASRAYKFEYGTADFSDRFNPHEETSVASTPDDATADPVSVDISGLTAGMTYYYRILVSPNVGISYIITNSSFTTVGKPTVATQDAANVGTDTATLAGTVNPKGDATAYWFEYGPSESLGSVSEHVSLGSGFTTLSVSNALAFSAGTTTYFRIVATNSVGRSEGNILTFTTTALLLGTSDLLVSPSAGGDSVALAAGAGQSSLWTASAHDPWLHLSPENQAGMGSTNVVFTFDPNSGSTRKGTLTIAGRTVTVTQAGSTYVPAAASPLVTSGLNSPVGVAVDRVGNVFVADAGDNSIKQWQLASRMVTDLVSTGLNSPSGVAVDSAGSLYISDQNNNLLKKWDPSSQSIATLEPSGLGSPHGVAVDEAGNVFIADFDNAAVKRLDAVARTTSTLVSSDSGLAGTTGVAVDLGGKVYIADNNRAITVWNPGNQTASTLVSGLTAVPRSVTVDGSGHVYFPDPSSGSIKQWNAAGKTVVTALAAGLTSPSGVAVDGAGNIYVSDDATGVITKLPRAFLDATHRTVPSHAGTDSLPAVLPATVDLSGSFAPSSDQPWLTITGVTNGVVSFAFTANNSGSNRMANIKLLGQSVGITQTLPATQAVNSFLFANGVGGGQPAGNPGGAFGFQFNGAPGAAYTVFATTNIELPISEWQNLGSAIETPGGSGHFQFSDLTATDSIKFYVVIGQ